MSLYKFSGNYKNQNKVSIFWFDFNDEFYKIFIYKFIRLVTIFISFWELSYEILVEIS